MSNPKILIEVENFGNITAELYPEKAPETVENFLKLVNEGFYKNLIFHRVIEGFMLQGGAFNEIFGHKEAEAIKGEFAANGFNKNDIIHERGVLSMARTSNPNSASSQFFIMHQNAPHLDGQYAAFGKVIEGFDVIDKIASVETGSYQYFNDVPLDPVVIKNITVTQ